MVSMAIGSIILLVVISWNILGMLLLEVLFENDEWKNWFVPTNVFRHHRNLNMPTAILISILVNLMCPIVTIGFWIYYIYITRKNKTDDYKG